MELELTLKMSEFLLVAGVNECNSDLSPTIYDLRAKSILPFVYSQPTGRRPVISS
jgi:hypothetical protein